MRADNYLWRIETLHPMFSGVEGVVPLNQLKAAAAEYQAGLTGERPLSLTASTRPIASLDRPSRSSSSTSSPISPPLNTHIVLPSLCSNVLSVGVEHNSTLVEALRASAGEPRSIPLTGISDVIVRLPEDGLGTDRDRRGSSVGPRWMLIVDEDRAADEDCIVGTTE